MAGNLKDNLLGASFRKFRQSGVTTIVRSTLDASTRADFVECGPRPVRMSARVPQAAVNPTWNEIVLRQTASGFLCKPQQGFDRAQGIHVQGNLAHAVLILGVLVNEDLCR